jgi:hypothetical protein
LLSVFNYVESIDDVNIEIYLHDTQIPSDTRILQENFIGMIMLPLSKNRIIFFLMKIKFYIKKKVKQI